MSSVATYLNFPGTTEEAFDFYATIFNPGYQCPIMRFNDMGSDPSMPPLSEDDLNKILHIELPILNGHVLMGTDVLESMGQHVTIGNNTTISLNFDTRDDALHHYEALSDGASDATGMNDMPWGFYWGCCLDRYGIRWMFSTPTS
jgi:PhnB protein